MCANKLCQHSRHCFHEAVHGFLALQECGTTCSRVAMVLPLVLSCCGRTKRVLMRLPHKLFDVFGEAAYQLQHALSDIVSSISPHMRQISVHVKMSEQVWKC